MGSVIWIKWGRDSSDLSDSNQVQLVIRVTRLPDSNQVKSVIRVIGFEKFMFSSIQFYSSQDMYMIRVIHVKSFFFIFEILWHFPFNLTWIKNTYGSCSNNSINWLKASWSSSNITIELFMLKKRIDLILDSNMCNHERDSINNNKHNKSDKTCNKTILGFSLGMY